VCPTQRVPTLASVTEPLPVFIWHTANHPVRYMYTAATKSLCAALFRRRYWVSEGYDRGGCNMGEPEDSFSPSMLVSCSNSHSISGSDSYSYSRSDIHCAASDVIGEVSLGGE
jgi:hypothetical protein